MIEYFFLGAFVSVLALITLRWIEPLVNDIVEAIQTALAIS